ncbi:DUF6731 family protein [Paenibacillus sp. FSL R5-0473]|uniref:DUF6731 family protein n=1 Tax=Paenibacillus sp. FSL R5-0473 TaxID=2921642 RepID=UPI0030F81EDA
MPKHVRFDYFKVYARRNIPETNRAEERPCDLSVLLQTLKEMEPKSRVFAVKNDVARLQSIKLNNDKWEMHFIRIRKEHFPLKTNDNGEFGYFDDLTNAEGFGEEVSALYDPTNSAIMIRRNASSLAPSAITNYFTRVINEEGYTIFMKPLVHPSSLELIKQDHLIKSAEIAVADIKNARPRTKKALGSIVAKAQNVKESVDVVFKISIAQKGSKKYSKLPIYDDIMDLVSDEKVKRAEVKVKADQDASVEPYDLLQHRLIDYHSFPDTDINTESRNILHTTVMGQMQRIYRNRVEQINSVYE